MSQFVHGFFHRPLEEHIFIRRLTIKFIPKAVKGNNSYPLTFIGITEHEPLRGLAKVEICDCEQYVAVSGTVLQHNGKQRRGEHLTARAVDGASGNAQLLLDRAGIEKPFFQTSTQA